MDSTIFGLSPWAFYVVASALFLLGATLVIYVLTGPRPEYDPGSDE